MDENNNTTNYIQNPHQSSRKGLYIILVLILVAIVVALTFLKERSHESKGDIAREQILEDINAESQFTLTKEEETQIRKDISKDSKQTLSNEEKASIIRSLQE